jgi:hypothetical protein
MCYKLLVVVVVVVAAAVVVVAVASVFLWVVALAVVCLL